MIKIIDMNETINAETVKKIENLKSLVEKKGVVKDEVIKHLEELRPLFMTENNPLLTRIVRMTAEYLEENGQFDLNLLAEVDEEDEEEVDLRINTESEDSFNEMKANFLYLLDLFEHSDNKYNHDELQRIKQIYIENDIS